MSSDARYFAFVRDGNIWHRDRLAELGVETKITIGYPNCAADGTSSTPFITADGQVIAFLSTASNLVETDANGHGQDIFIYSMRPKAVPPYDPNCPYNACGACPIGDPSTGAIGTVRIQNTGPSAGDPVNLATGSEVYLPVPDLDIYNPTGARVYFQRAYYSSQARKGVASPGLSPGWVHNYDVTLQTAQQAGGAGTEDALPQRRGRHIAAILQYERSAHRGVYSANRGSLQYHRDSGHDGGHLAVCDGDLERPDQVAVHPVRQCLCADPDLKPHGPLY